MSCVFCDIVNKKAASYTIYEDEEYIAFLDRYPITIGHTLVLPKKHFERVKDLTQEKFCGLYARVHALNRLIPPRLDATASHISVNDGVAANQLVPHLHVHIVPRSENDGARFTERKILSPDRMEEIRKKLEVKELKLTF